MERLIILCTDGGQLSLLVPAAELVTTMEALNRASWVEWIMRAD